MSKENRFPATALLMLAAGTGFQGCATTGAPDIHGNVSPAATSAPGAARVSKDMVTVENLLRWSLEGPMGADKTAAGLRQIFQLRESKPSLFTGKGPVELVDNYVLSFTWIGLGPNRIDIGLKQEPCFPADRAVALIDAELDPVFQDAHGVDLGRTYNAERNGMLVRIDTTPDTSQCVTSIHVSPIRRSSE